MQNQWLNKNFNNTLIIFFNGWGMDASPFKNLTIQKADLLMLYDYSNLAPPPDLQPKKLFSYTNVYIIGWSMGVWAAAISKSWLPLNSQYLLAINGTLKPIHAHYGINPKLYYKTLTHFSSNTRKKFYHNMFTSSDDFKHFLVCQPQHSLEKQKNELAQLWLNIITKPLPVPEVKFTSSLISTQDRIIPTNHQSNFWGNKTNYSLLPTGHFPFRLWKSWEELLAYANNK